MVEVDLVRPCSIEASYRFVEFALVVLVVVIIVVVVSPFPVGSLSRLSAFLLYQ